MSLFRYLNVYDRFTSVLDDSANQDVTSFLKKKHTLEEFTNVTEAFIVKSVTLLVFSLWIRPNPR